MLVPPSARDDETGVIAQFTSLPRQIRKSPPGPTDIRLTMRSHTDPRGFDLRADVEKLPGFSANADIPEVVRGTGTDGPVVESLETRSNAADLMIHHASADKY